MALHLYCPTEKAVLLLAIPDEKGLFYFSYQDKELPGIWFRTKPLLPINQQLTEVAEKFLGCKGLATKMSINQQFAGKLSDKEGQEATLYLASLESGLIKVKSEWTTLPRLLGQMPKNRNRLPYLLAWQVLSGALSQMTQALEVDDQLNPIQPR